MLPRRGGGSPAPARSAPLCAARAPLGSRDFSRAARRRTALARRSASALLVALLGRARARAALPVCLERSRRRRSFGDSSLGSASAAGASRGVAALQPRLPAPRRWAPRARGLLDSRGSSRARAPLRRSLLRGLRPPRQLELLRGGPSGASGASACGLRPARSRSLVSRVRRPSSCSSGSRSGSALRVDAERALARHGERTCEVALVRPSRAVSSSSPVAFERRMLEQLLAQSAICSVSSWSGMSRISLACISR